MSLTNTALVLLVRCFLVFLFGKEKRGQLAPNDRTKTIPLHSYPKLTQCRAIIFVFFCNSRLTLPFGLVSLTNSIVSGLSSRSSHAFPSCFLCALVSPVLPACFPNHQTLHPCFGILGITPCSRCPRILATSAPMEREYLAKSPDIRCAPFVQYRSGSPYCPHSSLLGTWCRSPRIFPFQLSVLFSIRNRNPHPFHFCSNRELPSPLHLECPNPKHSGFPRCANRIRCPIRTNFHLRIRHIDRFPNRATKRISGEPNRGFRDPFFSNGAGRHQRSPLFRTRWRRWGSGLHSIGSFECPNFVESNCLDRFRRLSNDWFLDLFR